MPTHLTLDEVLREANDMESVLKTDLYPAAMPATVGNILGLAALDVAMGHFMAIRFLVSHRTDVDSTVRSLMRPLVEASYRAGWLKFIATEDELETVQTDPRGGVFPSLPAIGKSLDAYDNETIFSVTLVDVVLVHDFTHCGIQTLRRHYDEERGIGPIHDPVELATIIHRALVVIGRTALLFTQSMGMDEASLRIAKLMSRRIES